MIGIQEQKLGKKCQISTHIIEILNIHSMIMMGKMMLVQCVIKIVDRRHVVKMIVIHHLITIVHQIIEIVNMYFPVENVQNQAVIVNVDVHRITEMIQIYRVVEVETWNIHHAMEIIQICLGIVIVKVHRIIDIIKVLVIIKIFPQIIELQKGQMIFGWLIGLD